MRGTACPKEMSLFEGAGSVYRPSFVPAVVHFLGWSADCLKAPPIAAHSGRQRVTFGWKCLSPKQPSVVHVCGSVHPPFPYLRTPVPVKGITNMRTVPLLASQVFLAKALELQPQHQDYFPRRANHRTQRPFSEDTHSVNDDRLPQRLLSHHSTQRPRFPAIEPVRLHSISYVVPSSSGPSFLVPMHVLR